MSVPPSDAEQLAQFGYKQELHRTLGGFSSFAAGFSYISILTGMFQTSALGFFFAGPAFSWMWLVVLGGQMMVALQFAELSAHYPLAGSVYQWSKQVGRKAWAWHTGWVYLWAQLVTVAAVATGWQVVLPPISSHFQIVGSIDNSANLFSSDFAENAIILGMIMVCLTTIINMLGVNVMSRVNNVGVIAELIGAAGLIILFLIHANRGPGTVLTETANTANVPVNHSLGYLGALLVGAFMPLYVMYGFDTAGSLAEETGDPRRKAPRAVLQALGTAGIMGFLLIVFGAMAASDSLYKDPTSLGLSAITTDVLGSTWGKIFLADVAVAIFVCCLAIHAMGVRILFAMGRDNNLPFASRLAHVSGTRRVPVTPAIFVGAFAFVLLLVNIFNQYAFQMIIALGIIFIYLSYLGVTIPLLRRRMEGWPGTLADDSRGLFRLGGAATLTNGIAIVYGAIMVVNLMWPRDYFYGTKWYSHYGPLCVPPLVLLAGIVLYNLYQRDRMGVLDEHRAAQGVEELHEPPPVHGGP
jgi:urea carboxylase system permease